MIAFGLLLLCSAVVLVVLIFAGTSQSIGTSSVQMFLSCFVFVGTLLFNEIESFTREPVPFVIGCGVLVVSLFSALQSLARLSAAYVSASRLKDTMS